MSSTTESSGDRKFSVNHSAIDIDKIGPKGMPCMLDKEGNLSYIDLPNTIVLAGDLFKYMLHETRQNNNKERSRGMQEFFKHGEFMEDLHEVSKLYRKPPKPPEEIPLECKPDPLLKTKTIVNALTKDSTHGNLTVQVEKLSKVEPISLLYFSLISIADDE